MLTPDDMKSFAAVGVLGVGYVALRQAFVRRPKFSGRVAERTDLIAWNPAIADCVQRIASVLVEDELVDVLDRVEQIRAAAQSSERASSWALQTAVASTLSAVGRLARRWRGAATADEIRVQSAVVEDVLPVFEELLQTVQHNHMLDSLVT